jgi:PAS domain S-box-containing protein
MTAKTPPSLLIEGFLAQTKEHAIICIDPDETISAWLGGAQDIFGYAEEEIVGRHCSIFFTPEDQGRELPKHELDVARRDGRSEDDRWHVRRDGTRIWATGAVQGVRDSAGQVIGFVKVVRDRSDLRVRLDNAENKLERTRTFLRTLGHELRNPLAPLQSALAILERTNTDPRGERALQIGLAQLGSLKRLADDLVDVTRLDVGKVEMDLQTADLCGLLRDACVAFDPQAKEKGLDFQTIVPDRPLLATIDHQRFQQVILNLLSNALKYTPPGGRIWLKATREDEHVVVRVEDTGMGISPQMLPKLFELFSRETTAQDAAPEGLGIGLAVVRQVVELHEGNVEARSSGVGKGSEFTVRLPAAPGT